MHQPQLESWNGSLLKVRAAVAASEGEDGPATYGIIEAQARTLVDKQQRLVTLDQLDVVRADFPSAPQQSSARASGWAGQAGMSYNSRTGTLAAGQRGAAANVYTGRYASGARGAATNANTGISAATRQGTVGNARTGQEISAGQSVMYDRNTGEAMRKGHISGEQGTVSRVGDDIYAGHDGNVYQRSDNGWQQVEHGGGSTQAAEQTRQQLDRDMSARSHGADRYAGRQASTRSMSRGGGRRR